MSDESGDGIYMPNAKIQGQGIAIGTGASASVAIGAAEASLRDQGQNEIAELLRALQAAVERDRDRLEDADDVQQAVAQVAQQLTATESPNKLTLRGMLQAIAQAAATSTAVATAAQALAGAVQQLT